MGRSGSIDRRSGLRVKQHSSGSTNVVRFLTAGLALFCLFFLLGIIKVKSLDIRTEREKTEIGNKNKKLNK